MKEVRRRAVLPKLSGPCRVGVFKPVDSETGCFSGKFVDLGGGVNP
jgi:hypothetical protein